MPLFNSFPKKVVHCFTPTICLAPLQDESKSGFFYTQSTSYMTPRVEINLFFEQGLYMTLFASTAGGL
jgi:hypothetical protein